MIKIVYTAEKVSVSGFWSLACPISGCNAYLRMHVGQVVNIYIYDFSTSPCILKTKPERRRGGVKPVSIQGC